MTEDIDHFGQLLGETARAWRAVLDRRLQPLGLSGARWLVLLHVARAGETLVQKELARRVGIGGPALVGLLDRMARDGWIERRAHGEDRRRKAVHLTQKARRVIPRIEASAAELRDELLRDLPRAELQRCMRLLSRIKREAERGVD